MATITKKNRQFIYERDKVCLRCGSERNKTIDHVIPISKNGSNHVSNLQLLCWKCNTLKADNIADYRNHDCIIEIPIKPKEKKVKPKKYEGGICYVNENTIHNIKPIKGTMYIGLFGIESNLINFHT